MSGEVSKPLSAEIRNERDIDKWTKVQNWRQNVHFLTTIQKYQF